MIDDLPIYLQFAYLYDISSPKSRGMTPRTSCDLSVSWLVGLVHLPDWTCLYNTNILTCMAQPPVGL